MQQRDSLGRLRPDVPVWVLEQFLQAGADGLHLDVGAVLSRQVTQQERCNGGGGGGWSLVRGYMGERNIACESRAASRARKPSKIQLAKQTATNDEGNNASAPRWQPSASHQNTSQ